MREPTRRHTVVTAGNGKEYQAVEAHRIGKTSLCRGSDATKAQGWIFIDNTPEAFAEYIKEQP